MEMRSFFNFKGWFMDLKRILVIDCAGLIGSRVVEERRSKGN